jgi:IS1 family transposase
MNKLTAEKQVQVIKCLVEGNSIRSTVRMTGVSMNTIQKLVLEVGATCAIYQNTKFKSLVCQKVQCDEIWAFCHSKEKNVPKELRGQHGYGDVWTFTAIDADTKLVISWIMGKRNTETAVEFMKDVHSRIANKVQLTTDGYHPYFLAVKNAFGTEIDYAVLRKIYGHNGQPSQRYSPAVCIAAEKEVITGSPDPKHVSTSFIERQNLTMRMSMRRFTRLTNAFSKKLTNMKAAVDLHFMYYNFCRVHQTLGKTPAMASGLTDKVWKIEDVLELMEVKTKAA